MQSTPGHSQDQVPGPTDAFPLAASSCADRGEKSGGGRSPAALVWPPRALQPGRRCAGGDGSQGGGGVETLLGAKTQADARGRRPREDGS